MGPRALRGVDVFERGTEEVRCYRIFSLARSYWPGLCMRAYLRHAYSARQTPAKRRLLVVTRSRCTLAAILAEDLLSQLLILALAATCTMLSLLLVYAAL